MFSGDGEATHATSEPNVYAGWLIQKKKNMHPDFSLTQDYNVVMSSKNAGKETIKNLVMLRYQLMVSMPDWMKCSCRKKFN